MRKMIQTQHEIMIIIWAISDAFVDNDILLEDKVNSSLLSCCTSDALLSLPIAELAIGQERIDKHGKHIVEPLSFANVPTAHGVQLTAPIEEAKKPGGHGIHALLLEPAVLPLKNPALHGMHEALDLAPIVSEYVPAEHSIHFPLLPYVPIGHSIQAVGDLAPSLIVYNPSSQTLHLSEPVCDE